MAEEDDHRIEARLTGAARGISPTTEQIQTLLARQVEHEKLTRPAAEISFDDVLKDKQALQRDPTELAPRPGDPLRKSLSAAANRPATADFPASANLPVTAGRQQKSALAPSGPQLKSAPSPGIHAPRAKVIIRG